MDNFEMQDRVCQIISALFAVPKEQVIPASSTETIEKWDSMGHLSLILELEQEFSAQFTPEQVEQMHSVAAIMEELKSQQSAGAVSAWG